MKRRTFLGAALAGATAGCLRLESDGEASSTRRTDDTGTATTERATTSSESTTTDGPAPVVSGFEVAWDQSDAGVGANFRPDVLVEDGDELLAFGARAARVDPSERAGLATADLTNDGEHRVVTTESAAVTDDGVYVGTRDRPRVVALSRDAATVEWSFGADTGLESVGDVAVVDGVVYAGVRGREPDRAALYALDAATGEELFVREWDDGHYLTSLAARDDVVFVGVGGQGGYPDALDVATGELVDAAVRYGFDVPYRVRATDAGLVGVGDERLTLREWGSFDLAVEHSLVGYPSTAPVVRDGAVYVANDPGVRAVDAGDGTERWLARTTDRVRRPPAFDDAGVAFAADDAGILYALDAATGEILHEAEPFEFPVSDLAFVDGGLVAASNGLRGLEVVRD